MMVEVRAKLRYRALPPYFLREIGLPELQDELLIFPVDSASTIIRIDN
jgi:hypothetical protein